MKGQTTEFTAPLGRVRTGRMIFASGASHIRLQVDPGMPEFYQAQFRGSVPSMRLQEDTLMIQCARFPFYLLPAYQDGLQAKITLNGSIPWEIEIRCGVSELEADLRGLSLRSLDVLGGADQLALQLSQPAENSFLYLSGGVGKADISRPAGVGVRLLMNGGVSQLVFDDRRFGSMDGETRLESTDFQDSEHRYEIAISDGAGSLRIDRRK